MAVCIWYLFAEPNFREEGFYEKFGTAFTYVMSSMRQNGFKSQLKWEGLLASGRKCWRKKIDATDDRRRWKMGDY